MFVFGHPKIGMVLVSYAWFNLGLADLDEVVELLFAYILRPSYEPKIKIFG
jgi:hypothetical protein